MISQKSPPKVPVDAGRSDPRWRVAAICLVLAAITFAVFGQTLRHGFVDYDDNDYVYDNPVVAQGLTLKGIVWAFTGAHADNWHPLTWLSHMLDCQLYGLNPAGHHLTNVLLHTVSVIALFLVLRQMTGALWRCAFVAAVFAIHPLRVESVAWVAERKDVLSGLFFILTIGAYVRYVGLLSAANPNHNPNLNLLSRRYLLVLLLFAMGLMCKPMLVTLPMVLLLLDYWPLQRNEPVGKLMFEKLPLLALSAASCVATVLAQHETIQSIKSYSLPLRMANALVACMVYLGQMVWPAGLAPFYPYPHNGLPAWQVALAGTMLAGFSAVAWRERRTQPWLLLGWLWYLVMLLPVVGVIQVGGQARADRYTYLPQIGICVAVTWLVAECRFSRTVFGSLMAGVVAVLMVCAWRQAAYWQNSETLWTRALACTTSNNVAHYGMGNVFLKRGRLDDAIAQYQEALRINPSNAEAHYNLGLALFQKGKMEEAISQYQQALQINPGHAEAHYNLGNTLRQKDRMDEAIFQYQQALQINPDYAEDRNNLGDVLLQQGGVDEAIAEFQRALQTMPDNASIHFNLAKALLQKGKEEEAIAHFQKGLQIKPDNVEMQFKLGNALLHRGRVDEAISHYQQALQIKPDYVDVLNNLGSALIGKGNLDEAIVHFQNALQIKPNNAEAHNNLGRALLLNGKVDEAIPHFQIALRIKPGYAQAHANLGNALLRQGNVPEAIAHFQQSLKFGPADPVVQNNLAWLLATGSVASLRDGNKAVELARQADALTGGQNPFILNTLSAALAEVGRFSEAVETARRALDFATAQSQTQLAGQIRFEIKLYQAGQPFRSPGSAH